jgi:hypothetical protein
MEDEMSGICGAYGVMGQTYKVLMVNPEGKRQLLLSRRRWEYNIKIYVKKIDLRGRRLDTFLR